MGDEFLGVFNSGVGGNEFFSNGNGLFEVVVGVVGEVFVRNGFEQSLNVVLLDVGDGLQFGFEGFEFLVERLF